MDPIERHKVIQRVVGSLGSIAAIALFFSVDGEAAGRISVPEVLRGVVFFGGPFFLFFFVRRSPP